LLCVKPTRQIEQRVSRDAEQLRHPDDQVRTRTSRQVIVFSCADLGYVNLQGCCRCAFREPLAL